jgi:hypothetical protein
MIVVELLSQLSNVEVIAAGNKIRELARLRRVYGSQWRKMNGIALVRLMDLQTARAEVHWYEVHGIGKREFKAVRILSNPA